jgi:hypothetical protein
VRIPLLVLLCCVALPVAAIDCSAPVTTAPTAGPTAPAPGLDGNIASGSTSDPAFGESASELAVDAVLARRHDEQCGEPVVSAEGYQKQTEFDNTPYRYNMKPGQKMSAADFDAWMKSRGIRIVGAVDDAPAVAEVAATEVAATSTESAAAPASATTPAAAGPATPVVAK